MMTDLQSMTDTEFFDATPVDVNDWTPEQSAECDRRWRISHLKSATKLEVQWTEEGKRFAWIDGQPDYVSNEDWDLYYFEQTLDDWPPDQKPFKRRFRLSMAGGGQIRVTEQFRWLCMTDCAPWFGNWDDPQLMITTVVDDKLKSFAAYIDKVVGEMTYAAVVSQRAPQDVIDRAAKTFSLIDRDPENFQALLAHRKRCQLCNHPLKDEVSKILTIGPSCAKRIKVPHTRATANLVLKRKRELLGDDYKDMEIPHD